MIEYCTELLSLGLYTYTCNLSSYLLYHNILMSFLNLETKVVIIKVLTSNDLNPERVIVTVLMRAREKVVSILLILGVSPLSPFPSLG